MKQHLWQPHPNPIILEGFKPQKCAVCGLERYHQSVRMPDETVHYYELYWRNHRYLGEEDIPCVDWEEENAKRID